MSRITADVLAPASDGLHPLRVARALRGLSQRELEQIAGLPHTTLSHVERGRRGLDPVSAHRIAIAIDADVDLLRLRRDR